MMVRKLACFASVALGCAKVNAFSLQTTTTAPSNALRPSTLVPTGAPLAAPFRTEGGVTKSSSGKSPSWTALFMADTFGDAEASPTQLRASAGDMVAEPELETPEKESLMVPRNLGERIALKLDVNEVLNTSVVVILAVGILWKIAMVDPAMTRGWSAEEVARHIAANAWSGYLTVLRDNPIATKGVTSATVYTIGDVIAQKTEGASMGELDRPRILHSMLAGGLGHGPLSHFWYQFSEDFFNNVLQLTQWWSFIPKVAIDQALWGPIWNNTYIVLLGLMKLESFESIWGDIRRTTIPLVVSGLKLWPLAHCVTYGLMPVENRLLWVDMVEILWVTILATQAAGVDTAAEESVAEDKAALVTEN